MATRITCVVPDGSDPDTRIDSVGGVGWTLSEDIVIDEIEDGANYYVEVGHERVAVVVAEQNGRNTSAPTPTRTPRTTSSPYPLLALSNPA